jgi:hypothetical protein
MPVVTRIRATRTCAGCGGRVEAGDSFCPACGARQAPDPLTPAPLPTAYESDHIDRSATATVLLALLVAAVLLLVFGWLVGRVSASLDGGDDGDGGDPDADAAETMDAYAPIAVEWAGKHDHVAEEAAGDDANGLATAAEDARIWIDVAREDLAALEADTAGASADLYAELVDIFDERAAVLVDIESTAVAGGDGPDAVGDDLAALTELDDRADAATCEIAGVMRAEGDDPDDHITPGMGVAC